jgi:phosphohistidine swiveling domain-containing protein
MLVDDERMLNPVKKSTILVMQEKASKLKETGILDFWKEYSWLPCLDLWNEPWTLEKAKEFVKESGVVEKRDVPKSKDSIVSMIQELGYIMDARDDYRRKAIFLIQPFFREIASRHNLTLKEVAFLTSNEIISLLTGEKISFSKKREDGFLLFLETDVIKLVESGFEKVLSKKGFAEGKEAFEVKGLVACSGKAVGTARIVKTVHDLLKVEKGDILISPMTHPDYIIAMRKAAAIVTDEGGLLCHAAIVSRELGTPCIVGTKNATSVFGNGDKIEVDAEKGIVRVVK